jgi:hypothetical protein
MNETMNLAAKIGSILYVLWGLVHVEAALEVYRLGSRLEEGMVRGRVLQVAWNLLFAALFAIVVGVILNWKNNRPGYWVNLVVVSATDLGFIVLVLIPGYVPIVPGGLGPLLWVLALLFSTIGIRGGDAALIPATAPAGGIGGKDTKQIA